MAPVRLPGAVATTRTSTPEVRRPGMRTHMAPREVCPTHRQAWQSRRTRRRRGAMHLHPAFRSRRRSWASVVSQRTRWVLSDLHVPM